MKLAFITLLLFQNFVIKIDSIKIVALPHNGLSHYKTMAILGKELTRRGHQFTMLQFNYTNRWEGVNTHILQTSVPEDCYKSMMFDHNISLLTLIKKHVRGMLAYMDIIEQQVYEMALDQQSLDYLSDCDLIIGEVLALSTPTFASYFNKPYILLHSMSVGILKHVFRLPTAATPYFNTRMPYPAPRVAQFFNFALVSAVQAYFDSYTQKTLDRIGDRFNVTDLPFDYKAPLLITQYDPIFDYPQPLHANMRNAGIWVMEEAKSLSAKYTDFISKQSNGFILVSFGTVFVLSSESLEKEENFINLLSKLGYGVIISSKTKHASLPDNVMVESYVPQNELLTHESIKMFVSHVGLLSMVEACYHGVPVLALPRAGDQFDNAYRLQHWMRIGRTMSFAEDNFEQIFNEIRAIISDPSIRENTARCSKMMRSKPIGYARERAADIVEDFVHWGYNASHLRPYVLDMPWYEYHMLDVLVAMVVCISLPYFALKLLRRNY